MLSIQDLLSDAASEICGVPDVRAHAGRRCIRDLCSVQASHHDPIDCRDPIHPKHERQRVLIAALVQDRYDDPHKIGRTDIVTKGKQGIGFRSADLFLFIQIADDLGAHGKTAKNP